MLDSLLPAGRQQLAVRPLPAHVRRLDLAGIRRLAEIDATPIGQNSRSTPATYSGAFDATPNAKRRRWKPGHFSFNTKAGQCPTRLRNSQRDTLYVFDEPSTGLHPTDIATLVGVFDRLLDDSATVIVIDHDLDLLAAADPLIDMGPVGGPDGGRIVAEGTPAQVAADAGSVTGSYLRPYVAASAKSRPAHVPSSSMNYCGYCSARSAEASPRRAHSANTAMPATSSP